MRALALALALGMPAASARAAALAAPAGRAVAALALPNADPVWHASLGMVRQWLLEPEALKTAAALDPYLTDLRALDPQSGAGRLALEPLASALAASCPTRDEKRALVASMTHLPFLEPVERLALLQALSHARRGAGPGVEAAVSRLTEAFAKGEADAEDLAALPALARGLRLYGPGAEARLGEARRAAALYQTRRVEAAADRILREHFGRTWRREDLPPAEAAPEAAAGDELRHPLFHREAALRGSARAQHALGLIHERGAAGRPEPRKAYAWHARAAVLGHEGSAAALPRLLERLSGPQLARAEEDAAWLLARLAAAAAGPVGEKRASDMAVRALTALFLIPAVLVSVHWGGPFFSLGMTLLAFASMLEYGDMLAAGRKPVSPLLAAIAGPLLAMSPAAGWSLPPLLAGVSVVVVLREVLRKDHSFERAAFTLFGTVLFGYLPAHLALVRGLAGGEALTLMTFAAVWASDTLAYLVGRRWGRHKVAPVLSPKKTWEGSLAGAAAGLAVTLLFWAAVPGLMSLPLALAAGLVLGVVGQLGGFASSMVKRAMGVKDSGTLLPGHGGFIDRFDALLLAAPILYYLLSLAR